MAAPIQEIAREFAASHGVDIAMDTGGSETLLPKILVGASADIFVCHDPFEARVREAGRLAGSVRVGHLHPILAVQTGNPMGIRGVADLQRAGLRVGIGNPEFSTCGELFVASLRSRGSYDAVMKQIVLQSRSTTDVANGLVVGSLDAGVIWNFNAVLFTGRLEVVDAILDCPEVRVTVLGLTQSPGPRWRDAFLEWCRRPAALEAFRRHGYNRPDAPRTP
jgi:molybdate transport system substrate-binding protein